MDLFKAALVAGLLPFLGFSPAPSVPPRFTLAGHEVTVVGDLGGFALTVEREVLEPGVEVAHLRLRSETAAEPPEFALEWSFPSHDVQGQWTTWAYFNKTINPDWGPTRVVSKLASQAPVMSLFGSGDRNRLTFAASDALNTVVLHGAVREENARNYAGIRFFTERHRAVSEIELEVRFDARDVPYFEALSGVSDWWASHPGYEPAPVPEVARLPMYSTWYSYHQSLDLPAILGEVETAKELGYEAIIIDDGWQTLDSRRGYAFTGDWRPERIPEMRDFVDGVHERGMKLLLWYSVPLVGERSETFATFRGKYLRYWNGQGAYVLDPRYPEVRAHIIDTYRDAMRDWGIDGFKLDFMGFFVATDSTVLEARDGRDYASVNEATDRLMSDVMSALRAENPEIMIEFRQGYVGPLMRKYGNMFRAGDSPNSAIDNRIRTVDLRTLSGTTAVHSDMLMWSYDESVESAALQIENILFSVPQMSVRLADIPPDHFEMIRFWTAYWRENRGVLIDGRFLPTGPLQGYPIVTATDGTKRIIALYTDAVARVDVPEARIDVVNATLGERVILDVGAGRAAFDYLVRDALGREWGRGTLEGRGAIRVEMPPAGLLELTRTERGGPG
jgi:alpha-galactosidase